MYRTSIQELGHYLSSVHWGASSSSFLDPKVLKFFLSEEKELRALWRKKQASLWLCLLQSWQKVHRTNGVKFQPCSDPLSSLCPHPLGPGYWVGPPWHPSTHTWDFPGWKLPDPGVLSPLPAPTNCLGSVQLQSDLTVCQLLTRLHPSLSLKKS